MHGKAAMETERGNRGGRRWAVLALSGIMIGIAVLLGAGGARLLNLGGSGYYLLAGIALAASGVLLLWQRSAALAAHALLLAGTLAWALWEVGLDLWALGPRLALFFALGLLLLVPPVRRALRSPAGDGAGAPASLRTGSGLALVLALGANLVAAGAAWIADDPHGISGSLPGVRNPVVDMRVAAGEWPAYGRTGAGRRWSPLTQITPDNVDRLEVAWHFHTGDTRGRPGDPTETTFEVTPLKIGQRLYLCTPHQQVIALDATSGAEIWRFDPKIEDELALQHLTCRGLGYRPPAAARSGDPAETAGGNPAEACDARLYMPTSDGRLIALDPGDGRRCTGFGRDGEIDLWQNMPHPRPGAYYSTSPPVVTRDRIVIGGTVLDNVSTQEASGVIRAFDAASGELLWNWDPARPTQTEPIGPGEFYSANSPNSWSISSVDEKLGHVYVPLGNQPPDQWGGDRSPAVERHASSVVALDLATGQVDWHFQTVHHDLWDYDVPAQPSLLDLDIGGRRVPALVQPTKQGDLFVLDRRNGDPLLPVREVPVPGDAAAGDRAAPTQPTSALSFNPPELAGRSMWGATPLDMLWCRIELKRLRYDGRYTPPTTQGSLVYPGNFGVFNWGSVAVDPQRQVVFAAPARLAFVSRLVPRPDDRSLVVHPDGPPKGSLPALNENFGAPFAVELKPFLSPLQLPCQQPPWGLVAGADLTTGRVAWQHRNGTVRDLAPVPLPLPLGVPALGGPVVTAGGVAFLSGTLDYYVRGYDLTTGKELWKHRLPAGGQATPMTYLGADGRQYLLVVAGGHGSIGTKTGDSVIAYALP